MKTAKLTQIEANLLTAARTYGDDSLRKSVKSTVFAAAKDRFGVSRDTKVAVNVERPDDADYLELHLKDGGSAFGLDDNDQFVSYTAPTTRQLA